MLIIYKNTLCGILFLCFCTIGTTQENNSPREFHRDSIVKVMNLVHHHFLANEWKHIDRNWVRGTYYRGLMALYKSAGDKTILDKINKWSTKHGWRPGSEWPYPANRLTCSQTYLDLYFVEQDDNKIKRTRKFMDRRIDRKEPASEQGWFYVDALFVGTPAYIMMTRATNDPAYANFGNRMFWEVYSDLFDEEDNLFYRDKKAKDRLSANQKKILWSRGNGWAIASIPQILEHLPEQDSSFTLYADLLQRMAHSLIPRQGEDGFWRANLADTDEYSNPESSGTAFFTYAMAWGINNGYLDRTTFEPIVTKAWIALYNCVDEYGKVQWGQDVARKPEHVDKSDSREYVSGAFLLAGSEMLKMIR